MPQEGDRLGSDDAPVSIQVFNDIQCSSCRDDFLRTIPTLIERLRPPRQRQVPLPPLLERASPSELGFYGAEAAAEQGYGWQYAYLFFRNQDEADRFGIDQELPESIAGGIEELDIEEWEEDLEERRLRRCDRRAARKLRGTGPDLGIRFGQGDDRQRPEAAARRCRKARPGRGRNGDR